MAVDNLFMRKVTKLPKIIERQRAWLEFLSSSPELNSTEQCKAKANTQRHVQVRTQPAPEAAVRKALRTLSPSMPNNS